MSTPGGPTEESPRGHSKMPIAIMMLKRPSDLSEMWQECVLVSTQYLERGHEVDHSQKGGNYRLSLSRESKVPLVWMLFEVSRAK